MVKITQHRHVSQETKKPIWDHGFWPKAVKITEQVIMWVTLTAVALALACGAIWVIWQMLLFLFVAVCAILQAIFPFLIGAAIVCLLVSTAFHCTNIFALIGDIIAVIIIGILIHGCIS